MNQPNAADALLRDLPATLDVHPHQLDLLQDRVLLLRLSPRDFSEASFLDQRVVTRESGGAWLAWQAIADRLAAAPAGTPAGTPAHYVFHIGHCGSTLLSRLLAELGALPLREPLPWRTFAETLPELGQPQCRWSHARFEERLRLLCRLFERGSGPRAVKTTSFCNDLAGRILAANAQTRATIVHARPRAYIANMLAGPNSRLDLFSVAPMRLRRLMAQTGAEVGRLYEMSPGVVAAMSWACETAALAALVDETPKARVLVVDFDRFLVDPRGSLERLAQHVLPGTPAPRVAAVATSPALTRYSKAPEHAYDAALRAQVLAEADREWSDEIRAGLAWCEQAAARWPAVARALERFGPA